MSTVFDPLAPARATAGSPVKFPVAPHVSAESYFDAYADEFSRAGKTIETGALDRGAALLLEAYARGSRAFSCGNGGSASIANHMQCDHVKGVRTATDLTPRVHSLSTNVELVTAIANDLGDENIFSYRLQSQSEPGDELIAVSSYRAVRPISSRRSPGPGTTACARSRSPASTAARPGRWPTSASTSRAPITASSRTCISPSCTRWPSTSATRA